MMSMRVLVTGGAGFVGSSLAVWLRRQHPTWEVVAFDNLKRRGSELTLPRLGKAGVRFVHGDVRVAEDFESVGAIDLLLECSAEPSVLAGLSGSPAYVLQTNLGGTIQCLEHARRCRAAMLFLSTSRVYPIRQLADIPLREMETRFEIDAAAPGRPGLSVSGVAEEFSLDGARSIYGATKLASELLIQEYAEAYGLPSIIDRCGVLAGPWQMGKVDQGVVTHWVVSHVLGRPLRYIGYGGTGKQVRDVLHVDDLARLVDKQIEGIAVARATVYNVGGGVDCSVSLRELSALCIKATGSEVPLEGVPDTRTADVPFYATDARKVRERFAWRPEFTPQQIVDDVAKWVNAHRDALVAALG